MTATGNMKPPEASPQQMVAALEAMVIIAPVASL